jgi:PAS domain S-box-containing protein
MNNTYQEAVESVEIPRSDMRTCRRVTQETPPLLRGEVSDPVDEDLLDIPVPVAGSIDIEGVSILHVDDDPGINEVTKTLLERVDDDFSVVCESTVVGALNRLEDGTFDCVVSDYDMPNTNGIEFLEIVREQYPDLPFILFTGKGDEEVASEAISKGVTDYMQKGGGTDRYKMLANRVRNAVERYRTQQKFWNALTWYQRLVEQDLAGVFLVQDREFIYVNERFADIFGYPQGELVDASPLSIASGPDDEHIVSELTEIDLGSVDTFRYEFTGERADGTEVQVEVHGGSIRYEGRPGCIGILWDRDADESEDGQE